MSRNRKPLDQQAGNITKEDKDRKALEEQVVKTGAEDIGKTPAWLVDAVAKREYKRILKDLFFRESNLIPVSRASHDEIHALYKTKKAATQEELKQIIAQKEAGGI